MKYHFALKKNPWIHVLVCIYNFVTKKQFGKAVNIFAESNSDKHLVCIFLLFR